MASSLVLVRKFQRLARQEKDKGMYIHFVIQGMELFLLPVHFLLNSHGNLHEVFLWYQITLKSSLRA